MKEYDRVRTSSTCGPVILHDLAFPADLVEAQQLPEPLFTPATKATSGHDENISLRRMADDLGSELAGRLRDLSLRLYDSCAAYALSKGIIIADTKFEFGFDGDTLTLIDEICSPDSSRFWPLDRHRPGHSQPSFDKQYVRDYLTSIKWNRKPPAPPLPEDVVANTLRKYEEVERRLVVDAVGV